MKLITKQIENALANYPLYSQDGKTNKTIVCKFFLANFTWYVCEARKVENDFEFYGIIDNAGEKEFGYFMLSQLQRARGPWGLPVERDMYFKPQTVNASRFMNSSDNL